MLAFDVLCTDNLDRHLKFIAATYFVFIVWLLPIAKLANIFRISRYLICETNVSKKSACQF